jgi:hypothetical protein
MRETIYAVADRLNALLTFDNIPNAQEEYAQLFEIHSNTEEYTISFYGYPVWSTASDSIPEDNEEEQIYNECLNRVVNMRSAILHITATIPNKSWT